MDRGQAAAAFVERGQYRFRALPDESPIGGISVDTLKNKGVESIQGRLEVPDLQADLRERVVRGIAAKKLRRRAHARAGGGWKAQAL